MADLVFPGTFPSTRLRRNRTSPWLRELVAEHRLHPNDLILPLFIIEGENKEEPIESLPGISRLTLDLAVAKIKHAASLQIPAVALFPVVPKEKKTPNGSEALNPDNLLCTAIRVIKDSVGEIGIIADVALDPYTTHGHDGLVDDEDVINDETVDILCQQATLLAAAGADIVAPSDMMDGRVGSIRKVLDHRGFSNTKIMSYAVKYASHFYGPFRDAVGSANQLGNASKATYQMNPANRKEALHEVALDLEEGADMVIVKPGMPYLDILYQVHQRFPVPAFAYQVSGEYAMIKAAEEKGWLNGKQAMIESLLAFKRAGASGILTYAALEVAEML